MLSDWLPFLIYAVFAAIIPASMLAFTFIFAQRPATREGSGAPPRGRGSTRPRGSQ